MKQQIEAERTCLIMKRNPEESGISVNLKAKGVPKGKTPMTFTEANASVIVIVQISNSVYKVKNVF